jgi:hypothetical protein
MHGQRKLPVLGLASAIGPLVAFALLRALGRDEFRHFVSYSRLAALAALGGAIVAIVSLTREEKPMAVATVSLLASFVVGGVAIILVLVMSR